MEDFLGYSNNYIFIWLYCNDPNVNINDDLEIQELIYWMNSVAKDIGQSIKTIIYKLNNQNVDMLYDLIINPDTSKSKKDAIIKHLENN